MEPRRDFHATSAGGPPLLYVIERSLFLLINLAGSDNERYGTSEVDMLALRCERLDELAQQLALTHVARTQTQSRLDEEV